MYAFYVTNLRSSTKLEINKNLLYLYDYSKLSGILCSLDLLLRFQKLLIVCMIFCVEETNSLCWLRIGTKSLWPKKYLSHAFSAATTLKVKAAELSFCSFFCRSVVASYRALLCKNRALVFSNMFAEIFTINWFRCFFSVVWFHIFFKLASFLMVWILSALQVLSLD